ncbi:SH3-domain-containing protein [Stereum hirsutum FP-91666 SS1]|uniref:SH3-domain-containing protein n=1 Tax=Stereum hirsutum (strain FP-91666) TaxID=721885 RepID=UPI000440EAF4|nr:SH3-domain-containing protein [Stereum hirsutum FP-91666 SS1]EIM90807.1 SH3-domain-containing protein [Stereum hirsutum FP-91666 SS1]
MPDPAALIAHIVSQTRQNIEFLISQNELSRDSGRDILSKLPSSSSSSTSNNDHNIMALSDATRRMTIPEPSSSPAHSHNMPMPGGMMNSAVSTPQGPPPGRVTSPYSSPPPHAHHAPPPDFGPPVRRGVPPPGPKVVRAKALWSYNENGQDPNDLSFQAGDIIEIVTETNADWWTGKIGGRQGLFPSNYVEKLDSSSVSAPPYPPPSESRSPSYSSPEYNSYNNNNAPVPYQGPPPPQQVQGYNPYMNGPGAGAVQQPPPQQVQVQQEQPPQKESKYGGLKQTLATSAVGGVGFGAGSAIGSGLINSIF